MLGKKGERRFEVFHFLKTTRTTTKNLKQMCVCNRLKIRLHVKEKKSSATSERMEQDRPAAKVVADKLGIENSK